MADEGFCPYIFVLLSGSNGGKEMAKRGERAPAISGNVFVICNDMNHRLV